MSFIIHRLDQNLIISDLSPKAGMPSYRARRVYRNGKAVARYHDPLTAGELELVEALVSRFPHVERLIQDHGFFDPVNLAKQVERNNAALDLRILRGVFDYLKTAIVFETVVKAYEAKPAAARFSPHTSLDLYGRCLDSLQMHRGIALMATDLPVIERTRLSPDYRSSFYEVFSHLHLRLGKIEPAFELLEKAFAAKQTAALAQNLIDVGRLLKRDVDTTAYRNFLAK